MARPARWLLVATLALAAPAATARAECEVTGVASIERLRVRTPGHRLRTLAVTDLPVAVRPGRGDHYRDVRVLAPLAFAARTDAEIPWAVPRSRAVASGMLWLTPRVELETVRERLDEDELVIRAQVDTGVWVARVHVPCDAIAVGHGETGDPPPGWADGEGTRWNPLQDRIWLRHEPRRGPSVRVEAPDGLREPFVELERRGDWVRLAARFPSGAEIRGWSRQHHLTPPEPPDEPRPRFARRTPQARLALCRRTAPADDEYVGPANVSVGTLVRTERDGEAWATISEPAVYTVSWQTGSRWVRIVHVPGLRGDGRCPEVLRDAWVPRRTVTLQGEAVHGSIPGTLLGLE
ncbi:MAG TPA: hypothetical protein RMH99_06430 [Sandaracinaceae bacterium LLY-WYZ-13_1]|nr:hypothetical protein [Sandaracinaceae bacterium LLY-WYZ-13_1]